MTELFYTYQCDAIRLSQSHQVIWAVARTKLRYDGPIRWMDRVKLTAFPVKVSPVAIHLNLLVEGEDGTSRLRARQEVCAIDVANHTLRKTDTTPFPRDLTWPAPVFTDPLLPHQVEAGGREPGPSPPGPHLGHRYEPAYEQHGLRPLDPGHPPPPSFWNTHRIRDFDVHYVSEAVEGEELQVYCQETSGQLAVQIKRGETSWSRPSSSWSPGASKGEAHPSLGGTDHPLRADSEARENINIRVHADGSVRVSAGPRVSPEAVDAALRQRSAFLLRALDQFAAQAPLRPKPHTYGPGGNGLPAGQALSPSASSQVLRLRFGRPLLTFSSRCRTLRIRSAGCRPWRPF